MKYKKLNDGFVQWKNGNIGHRTKIKIIINPILRFIQFWTNEPLVIGSHCTIDETNDILMFHRYKLIRMKIQEKHNDRPYPISGNDQLPN